jgi:hypothetical protein
MVHRPPGDSKDTDRSQAHNCACALAPEANAGHYCSMETRSAAADFWRVFGGALILYLVGGAVSLGVVDTIVGSLIVAATFCAWASRAPRGATIGLAVFAALGAVAEAVFAIHEQNWWHLASTALDLGALLFASRAIGPARSSLADSRRRADAARDWDAKHSWDTKTGR